jgi:YVTN family beta-propeller protein
VFLAAPEGGTLAVASLSGSKGGTVALINTETLRVTGDYSVEKNTGSLVFANDGQSLYVASCGTCTKGAGGGGLFDINLLTKRKLSLSGSYQQPGVLAVDAKVNSLYVTLPSLGAVASINTTTNVVRKLIKIGHAPYGIIVSPNGRMVYVSDDNGEIIPIITATNETLKPLQIGASGPVEMAMASNGKALYIADTASNRLVVIDPMLNRIQKTIPVGSAPEVLLVTPRSDYVFLVTASNNLVRISTNTEVVTGRIKLPKIGVKDLAVSSDGQDLYVSNSQEDTVTAFGVNTDRIQWVVDVPGIGGPLALSASGKDLFLLGD